MPKYDDFIEDGGLIKVQGWARQGLTNEQIAKNIDIVMSTFYRWKLEHKEFSDALKKGKEVVDFEVENALLKRAIGYKYEEVTWERIQDPDARRSKDCEDGDLVITKKVEKYVNPDVTAIIFWLKNRMKNEWRTNPTPDGEESLQALDAVLDRIKSAF